MLRPWRSPVRTFFLPLSSILMNIHPTVYEHFDYSDFGVLQVSHYEHFFVQVHLCIYADYTSRNEISGLQWTNISILAAQWDGLQCGCTNWESIHGSDESVSVLSPHRCLKWPPLSSPWGQRPCGSCLWRRRRNLVFPWWHTKSYTLWTSQWGSSSSTCSSHLPCFDCVSCLCLLLQVLCIFWMSQLLFVFFWKKIFKSFHE